MAHSCVPFCAHCCNSSAQLFLLLRAARSRQCCTPVTGLERTPCEGSPSPSAPCWGLQSLSSSAHTQQLLPGKCCCGPALGAVGNAAGKRPQQQMGELQEQVQERGSPTEVEELLQAAGWMPRFVHLLWEVPCSELLRARAPARTSHDP